MTNEWRQPKSTAQQFPRTTAAVQLRVTTVEPETDPTTREAFFRSVEETTANLSKGGAFVGSWEPLSPGRRVILDIDLPGDPGPIQVAGQVVWTQRQLRTTDRGDLDAAGYGVEFTNVSASDRTRIDQYLESLKSQSVQPPSTSGKAPAVNYHEASPKESQTGARNAL